MKKLLTAGKILFIIALFGWIAFKFDARTARDILASARPEWGLLALLLAALANVFVAMRWERLIRGVWPEIRTALRQLYWFNLLALFYSIFIPTSIAGEAVRVYKLKNAYHADYPRSTIVIALDRLLGAFTWLMLFLVFPTPLRGNRLWLWGLLLVPVAFYLFRKKIALREHRLFDFSRHHPKDIILATFFSFMSQFIFIAANICIFRCFGVSISPTDCAGLTATTTLAAIVPISLFGIGFREGSLIAFLPLYGASPTQAMLATSFIILLNYMFGLTGGLIELGNAGWNFARLAHPPDELRKTIEQGHQ